MRKRLPLFLIACATILILWCGGRAQNSNGQPPAQSPGNAPRPQPDNTNTPGFKPEKQRRIRFRTGVLTSSFYGTSGLFSVIDAETLYKGKYLFGGGYNAFGRPANTRVSQGVVFGAYGLTEHLEFFFATTPIQSVSIGRPLQLSGPILQSALAQTAGGGRSLLNNSSNGFFPLPGANVSGAILGGILPGFPQGNSQLITDPLSGQAKNAFTTSSFINDFPFLGRSGTSFGDTTLGAKYRFLAFKDKDEKGAVQKSNEDESEKFSAALLGYVKFPVHQDSGVLKSPQGSLFKGSGSGTTDFGVIFATSNYIPIPIFGKKKIVATPPVNFDCPSLGTTTDPAQSTNPTSQNGAVNNSPGEEVVDYYTVNVHTNHGYLRNSDPSVNGLRLVDRRDSFLFAYGADTMLNSKVQALFELRHEKLVGGGTPNLIRHNPLDLTFGTKIYPRGVPGLKEVTDGEHRSTNFFSIGLAYRLSLNNSNSFNSIGSSKHNFIVQLNFGNTRIRGKLPPADVGRVECTDERRAQLAGLEIDKPRAKRGETVTITPKYSRGDGFNNNYYYFVDGVPVTSVDEDGDPTDVLHYKVALAPRAEPYKIRFIVQTVYAQVNPLTGESEAGRGRCKCDEQMIDLFVDNSPPTVTLEPEMIGPVSAQRTDTFTLTARPEDADNDTIHLSWSAPEKIRLEGGEGDKARTFSSAGLTPGGHYRVTVTASDSRDSATSRPVEIIVNTPPSVEAHAESPKDLRGVTQGEPIEVGAKVTDPDENDSHTYLWQLTGVTETGQPITQTFEAVSGERLTVPTQNLEVGHYTVTVTAADRVRDVSAPATVEFDIVRRAPKILFNFDDYTLLKSERQKLDAEAEWLKADQNRLVKIRFEGNADPRGSELYNVKLGCRRACMAKDYLVRRKHIDPSRVIITVSYGEKYVRGTDEQTWKEDRRVDLRYTRYTGDLQVNSGETLCEACPSLIKSQKRAGRKHMRKLRRRLPRSGS